jgi:hypothetical protein
MIARGSPRRLWRGLMAAAAAFLIVGLYSACDTLLEVELADRIDATYMEDPANIDLLMASAIADFECALGHFIVAGGHVGDELWDGQLGAASWIYDRRDDNMEGGDYAYQPCGGTQRFGVYMPLQTARYQADVAVRVLTNATDEEIEDRAAKLAKAHAYAGYARLLLGESMCSIAIDVGPEIPSQGVFALAEAEFTAVLDGSPSTDIRNMALVGRARARLNQGNTAGALTDAQQVPAGFVYYANYSTLSTRSSNLVYLHNVQAELSSVEDDFHDLTWRGVPDPRVDVTDQGRLTAGDDLTPYWTQNKYTSRDANIPIARYAEAQLIIAEIQGGATAVGIINALHTAAGIPGYDPATDPETIPQMIAMERMRELFLEGQHLYTKVRLSLPFTPAAGTAYQETGSKGGLYGSLTCFPLPLLEKDNNPNIP